MQNGKLPKIGVLLIGSKRFQTLGEGTADGTYSARKEKEAAELLKRFGAFSETVFPGIIYERSDADKAVDLFFASKVDCVAAIFLSWAEDFAWIRFLREMPSVPILFASLVRDTLSITDTQDENEFVDFLSAGALVGFQEGSGSLRRFNRPMTDIFIGTLEETAKRLECFAKAAVMRSVLRRSAVGLLSCYNEAMWATYVDPYNLFMKIGPELRFLSVAELVQEIEKTPDSTVEALCEELTAQYKIYPNVDLEKFHASVKASYAMEQIALQSGIDLLVLNDIDKVLFNQVGLRPGFAPTSPDNGLVVVPEGDIGAGLAVYILQMLTGKIANFIEPFYIDHEKRTFTAGHAGPNNYHENPENVVIARDERFAKTSYKYAGAPFAWTVFSAGVKTMLHMSETDGHMKMVCTVVEALPAKHALVSYSHGEFRHGEYTPEALFAEIAACGVTQHYAIAPGDVTAELKDLAMICGFEFHLI